MDMESKKLIIFFLAIGVGILINLAIKSSKRNALAEEQLELDRNLAEGKLPPPKPITLAQTIKAGLAIDGQLVKLGKSINFNTGTEPIAELGYLFVDLDLRNLGELISNLYIVDKVNVNVEEAMLQVNLVVDLLLALLNNTDITLYPHTKDNLAIATEILVKLPSYNSWITKQDVQEIMNRLNK